MTIPDGVEVPEELSDEEVDEEPQRRDEDPAVKYKKNQGPRKCRGPHSKIRKGHIIDWAWLRLSGTQTSF